MTNQLTVANEIARQLGGALRMIGAKNLLGDENSLRFKIRGSRKVNYVKITLNAADTYDVEYGKTGTRGEKIGPVTIRTPTYKVVATSDGIYNDMLHDDIERVTGLYTRF